MDQLAYKAALEWYIDNGVDEALDDVPMDYFAAPIIEKHETKAVQTSSGAPQTAVNATIPGAAHAREDAIKLAQGANTLEELRSVIASFDGIPLKKTASNLVFGEGNPDAKIMFIGDAPHTEEDKSGRPFMGASGYLFDLILASIGLDRIAENRPQSVYVSNILNWRPPGNRAPAPGEIEASLPFVERQIALVKPDFLVLLGTLPAQSLLARSEGLSKLRKNWQEYKPLSLADQGAEPIPALVSFHPTYLLGAPQQKRSMWADMLTLKSRLGEI